MMVFLSTVCFRRLRIVKLKQTLTFKARKDYIMSMPVTGTNSQNNVTSTNDTSSVSQETTKNLLSGQGIAGSSYVNASDNTSTAPSVLSASQEKTIDKLLTERLGIRDSDLRDLLKLLISAFAQLNNTQRMTDLTALQGLVEACKAKIEQMKTAADAQYDAAQKQAIGQIVGGALSIVISGVSLAGTAYYAKGLNGGLQKEFTMGAETIIKNTPAQCDAYIKAFQALGGLAQPLSGISTGVGSLKAAEDTYAKSAAEIQQEQLNLTMEIMRKALDQCSSSKKELMDAIQQMIQFIQQLIQQAAATEKTIVQA